MKKFLIQAMHLGLIVEIKALSIEQYTEMEISIKTLWNPKLKIHNVKVMTIPSTMLETLTDEVLGEFLIDQLKEFI